MQELMTKLLAELKRDKKKSAIMAALLLVALILIGRLAIRKPGPAPAAAATEATSSAAVLGETTAPAGDEADTVRDEYIKQIDTTVKRDVFVPTEGYFPPGKTNGRKSWRSLGGELSAEQEAIWNEGKELTLESTILSSAPKAIIEGHLVKAGDYVQGFRVIEIHPHSVMLEKGGVRVNLEMKHE